MGQISQIGHIGQMGHIGHIWTTKMLYLTFMIEKWGKVTGGEAEKILLSKDVDKQGRNNWPQNASLSYAL